MKDDLKAALEKFGNAITSLEHGVKETNSELEKDGVIQRFEFTFELLWKSLKIFLNEDGIDSKTPRECLRNAFKFGWVQDEQILLDMLLDRNNSTHIYSKKESEEIFERIKSEYIFEFKKILNELELKI